MRLFNLFYESNPKQRSRVQDWILDRPRLLQHRDATWQRWIRQTLFGYNKVPR